MTNAFNFMDNMNGLCAGLGRDRLLLFRPERRRPRPIPGGVARRSRPVAHCSAFSPTTFPRATIFLGDAGSHLVGYLLAVLAILPHFYSKQNPHSWAVLSPLWILAVPLVDLAWVVMLRWRAGKPFYIGDNNHLSHRLVRRGWSRTQAVLLDLAAGRADRGHRILVSPRPDRGRLLNQRCSCRVTAR